MVLASAKGRFLIFDICFLIFDMSSGPVAQLVRATNEDDTQRKKSKELTNIISSVTPKTTPFPQELQTIIEQWGSLPDHVKQTIRMLVDSSKKISDDVNDLG